MKQYLLRFQTGASPFVAANTLREAFARQADMPPEFFGRDPQTGRTISEVPRAGRDAAKTARNDRFGVELKAAIVLLRQAGEPVTVESLAQSMRPNTAIRCAERIRSQFLHLLAPGAAASQWAPPQATAAQRANPFALPAVRFVGGRTWVGLLVTGSDNKYLFDQALAPAIQIVNGLAGKPVPVEMETRDLAIEKTNELHPYFIRNLVLRRAHWKEKSEAERVGLVSASIERALERQGLAASLDIPPADLLDIKVASIIRPRALRLTADRGQTGQYFGLADVNFYLAAKLEGFWFCGNLTSRGYGRIGYLHPLLQNREES